MKNIVGSPARGATFLSRQGEIEKIINRLQNGNNIQIAAPRRIGKTSILFYLLDNEVNNYLYAYVDTESIDNEQDFYKKILKELLKKDWLSNSSRLQTAIQTGKKFIKSLKSVQIVSGTIEFSETQTDYYEELYNLLCGLEIDRKLILLLDEFPQTIINISQVGSDGLTKATKFLQRNRELRLDPIINQNIQFIYTGSIGLNHTVATLNASSFINDLNSIEIGQLSKREANDLIIALSKEKKLKFSEDSINYLISKIEWLIPFYIQLILQDILFANSENSEITQLEIDKAFDSIIEARNNNHFEHYYSRLKSQFKGLELDYVLKTLSDIAKNITCEKNYLFNLSAQYNVQARFKNILEILSYDGYINNSVSQNEYRFNSPILRLWWVKNICE